MKLSVHGLAIAFAVLEGAAALIIGIFVALFEFGQNLMDLMAILYVGFDASLTGILIGTFWGLVDGFVVGAVVAWVYNYFAERN